MGSTNLMNLTEEQAFEMPMVDMAYEILKNTNNPLYYRDLMQEVAKIKGLSPEEVSEVIAQLYTEINIDGRFACVGGNLWGLKRWYAVEKDDTLGTGQRPRIINDDDDDDADDEEIYREEDRYGDYGAYDEGQDEFGENEEEELFVEDDIVDEVEIDEDVVEVDEEMEDELEEDEFDDEPIDDDESLDDDK